MAKYFLAILLLGMVLVPGWALAAYNDVTFPQASDVYLSGPDITLTVSAGSNLNSITVQPAYISIILERDATDVSSITFTSADKYRMNNSAGTAITCGETTSTLTLTGPTTVGTSTVSISPERGLCSGSGGAAPSGGTGTTSVSAPAATPTPTTTPTPTATPSPTATPAATPSPSPTPTALVPIPTLPTNPTRSQIQEAISAIQNNIAFLLNELAKLQAPTVQPFGQDLFYGLWNNAEVKRLQEFLISKGYLTGAATGNYYLKTVEAVKAYQTAKGIVANGRFGPMTRAAANKDLGL